MGAVLDEKKEKIISDNSLKKNFYQIKFVLENNSLRNLFESCFTFNIKDHLAHSRRRN